ncbi:hypothetical protein [Paractinoplanes atraurantiacus]|uniref:Uncharacterized protein n=1 Tax=Paractinoplanes atraurantiacus TaxID=1036182 RepID=A0A285JYF8_9ACTN|nr:hypothetical protein [Actinoplanes atraurantiacus]SNY64787.1 hypothetical protein SAMN05421748_12748 [Actinoplanes atraurantiacus]
MAGRRYNCSCGKKRYRDEESALAAAAGDARTYDENVTVYRCPGGLAWHLTAHGFVPEALRSAGRRVAYALLSRESLDWTSIDTRDVRAAHRIVALGLASGRPPGPLRATDRAGLTRVVQIGLDAYAQPRPGHS